MDYEMEGARPRDNAKDLDRDCGTKYVMPEN